MTVADFLTRADALEKRGVAALFTADYRALRDEVKGAGLALRADRAAAERAGRKPIACLPEGKVPVDRDEMLAYLRAIPPAQRGVTVRAAFNRLMARKYPCP
ncbi:hypothetical protein SAMN06295910_2211 [Allosphingosinicella indica]|uniref:Rap1a immunity protein domain-containing protein n=2 Tax=Allosphingosinicella indica TaxID=941907 RepID=A0A1X7GSP5_9SPHN|nr:hypothetical protein SAMN06295910_2211 [Allosphingosinicella indica]